MIFCGTFFNATSVEKLVLYNSMNTAANILHGWNLDIMIHFIAVNILLASKLEKGEMNPT